MEIKTRSAIKSISWRMAGVLILGGVTYAYTRHWTQTSMITFLHHGVFLAVYFFHERFWEHVDFTGLPRKIMKMVTYETILGNFILAIITLIITGDVQMMGKITLTYISIKHVMYVINEFCWDKIKWGAKQYG